MKPMGLISTPFITFQEIKIKNIELFEDAWSLNAEFCDVIDLLRHVKPIPEKSLTMDLMEKIRKEI
jgi:hypothetical protein